jgi:hypothetical protein
MSFLIRVSYNRRILIYISRQQKANSRYPLPPDKQEDGEGDDEEDENDEDPDNHRHVTRWWRRSESPHWSQRNKEHM